MTPPTHTHTHTTTTTHTYTHTQGSPVADRVLEVGAIQRRTCETGRNSDTNSRADITPISTNHRAAVPSQTRSPALQYRRWCKRTKNRGPKRCQSPKQKRSRSQKNTYTSCYRSCTCPRPTTVPCLAPPCWVGPARRKCWRSATQMSGLKRRIGLQADCKQASTPVSIHTDTAHGTQHTAHGTRHMDTPHIRSSKHRSASDAGEHGHHAGHIARRVWRGTGLGLSGYLLYSADLRAEGVQK